MMSSTIGGKDVRWWQIKVILALLSIVNMNKMVNGLQFEYYPSDEPSEGDDCRTPIGEPGVCKYVNTCEPFMAKTIDYYSLGHCTYVGFSRVVCCPTMTGWAKNIEPAIATPLKITTSSPLLIGIERSAIRGSSSNMLVQPKEIEVQIGRGIHRTASNTGDHKPSSDFLNFISFSIPPRSSTRTTTTPTTTSITKERIQNERPSETACRRYKELNPASLSYLVLDQSPVISSSYVGLMYFNDNNVILGVHCGSSLISERYVLTAAHCVKDKQPVFARLGTAVKDKVDTLPIDIEIESVTMHPNYRFKSHYDDIALLRLKRDVEITAHVSPACLYSDTSDIDSNIPLVVIGSSYTNEAILLEKKVTTVPIKICNCTYIRFGVSRALISGINRGQYCVLDPELPKESCKSDPGGPLILIENKFSIISTIVGVVSFGYLCGNEVPSTYARVAHYLDWIESIVWPS